MTLRHLTAAAVALVIGAFVGATALSAEAEARGRHIGFRTGSCKRASCFARHPGGRYVYPLHARGRSYTRSRSYGGRRSFSGRSYGGYRGRYH